MIARGKAIDDLTKTTGSPERGEATLAEVSENGGFEGGEKGGEFGGRRRRHGEGDNNWSQFCEEIGTEILEANF
jgi:hypothetical protein